MNFDEFFLEWWDVTGNNGLDFGEDHDADTGFLAEFLPLMDMSNHQNFAGSAVLVDVCGLRLFLVNVRC